MREEILIQDVNEINERIFLDGHIYVCDSGRRDALYFAPYFAKKGISHISKVLRCEEIESALVDNKEKIEDHFSQKFGTWKNWNDYWKNGLDETFEKRSDTYRLARFYFLGDPIKITETPISKNDIKCFSTKELIEKSINRQIWTNYVLDFSDLLKILYEKGKKE